MARMYDGDSFFTLSDAGQTGLVILSGGLAVGMLALTWALARRRRLPVRLLIWATLFAGFEWLAPQVYYIYYLTIIDGLPMQWVVGAFPDLREAAMTALFQSGASISAHSRGGLGLLMLGAALTAGLDSRIGRNHQDGDGGSAGRNGQ